MSPCHRRSAGFAFTLIMLVAGVLVPAHAGVVDPNEPNDAIGQATAISCPSYVSVDATIDPLGDVDFYLLHAQPGQRVTVDIDARQNGSALDPILGIYDSNAVLQWLSDNDPAPFEPYDFDTFRDSYAFILAPDDGDVVIAVSAYPDGNFDGVDAETSGPYTLTVDCLDAPSPPAPGTLLGSTGNAGFSLIDIDTATGAGSLRYPLGMTFGQVTEIELRDDGVLLGALGGNNSALIEIDPATGAETLRCFHEAGSLTGLEYVNGTLYGSLIVSGQGGSELVIVGEPDGFGDCPLTHLGTTGFKALGGLAYDAAGDTLYGCVGSRVGGGDLVTCDRDTGACTSVGPTGIDDCAALEFSPLGTLYAGVGGRSADAGKLLTIDPATGQGTAVGPTGSPVLNGLAFVPGGETTNEPSAALCGSTTHYAWVRYDGGGANPNIAYRSCEVGGACGATQTLVAAPTAESAPQVACDGSAVLVVWEDRRDGNVDIAYRRSTDGGSTFEPLAFLARAGTDETAPALAMSGGVALVVWEDTRNGNLDLGFRRSVDGGATWSTFGFLVRSGFDESDPALGLDGNVAQLTWVDRRHGSDDLAYRRSADAGATWQPLTFLVRASADESDPAVAVDGSTVLVGWVDRRWGNEDLAYRRSGDSGATFATLTFLVRAPSADRSPVFGLGGLDGVLAWVDSRSGNRNISYRHSNDGGASWGATARLVAAPTDEANPACDVAGGLASCAWSDGRTLPPRPKERSSTDGGATWLTLRDLE